MKYMQYLIFCLVFVACNKEDRINNNPIYKKLIGKWVECENKLSSLEFKKNGQVKIVRFLERNLSLYPTRIISVDNPNPTWDEYYFTDGEARCGININDTWDTIRRNTYLTDNSSTSTSSFDTFYIRE